MVIDREGEINKMKTNLIDKLLALICRICPLCIVSRLIPDSSFSKIIRLYEKFCPFCRAYKKTRGDF